ncbi:MAG: phosphopantetheine-binding protein, partial [Nitrospira sp.]|nr:phosphopantetheine-binding protein [Nitrospira sp.]
GQLSRISQLTQRTNQFNCTTLQRSESEIQNLCASGELKGFGVEVKDRFGNYGLVGVMLFKTLTEAIYVDTFLLSCRALGRGVEHRMLAKLGEIATARGLNHVNVPYIPTQKNQPAFDFLDSIGVQFKQVISDLLEEYGSMGVWERRSEEVISHTPTHPYAHTLLFSKGWFYRFPAEYAARLTYAPYRGKVEACPEQSRGDRRLRATKRLNLIATELYDIGQILKTIRARRRVRPELETAFVLPRTPTEVTLAEIWAELLGIEQVGVHDYFFDLGGHSLLAYQLLSRVRETFQVELSVRALFTNLLTVAEMAKSIEQYQIENADTEEIVALLEELNELSDEEVKELLNREGGALLS